MADFQVSAAMVGSTVTLTLVDWGPPPATDYGFGVDWGEKDSNYMTGTSTSYAWTPAMLPGTPWPDPTFTYSHAGPYNLVAYRIYSV